jgi:hypothetical protein
MQIEVHAPPGIRRRSYADFLQRIRDENGGCLSLSCGSFHQGQAECYHQRREELQAPGADHDSGGADRGAHRSAFEAVMQSLTPLCTFLRPNIRIAAHHMGISC